VKDQRVIRTGADGTFGADRVAVGDGAIEGRRITSRLEVLRQNPAGCLGQRDWLRTDARADFAVDPSDRIYNRCKVLKAHE
jgi:hypothetical protein